MALRRRNGAESLLVVSVVVLCGGCRPVAAVRAEADPEGACRRVQGSTPRRFELFPVGGGYLRAPGDPLRGRVLQGFMAPSCLFIENMILILYSVLNYLLICMF